MGLQKDETITFRLILNIIQNPTQTVSERRLSVEGFGSQEDLSRSTYVFNIQYNEPMGF